MLCGLCHEVIVFERTLHTLFEPETHSICELCYRRYPLLPVYDVIPIEGGIIHYHVLIKRNRKKSPDAYMSFFKPYIMDFLKRRHTVTLFWFDEMDDHGFALLDPLRFGNLYVVTLYENR